MQQTVYTVTEVDEYQLVCFEVLAGDVEGREIVIDYTTISGTASKLFKVIFLYSRCYVYDIDTFLTATSDYTARSGEVTISEDALLQCVSIPIRTDSYLETTNECFTFRISAAATIDGLSIEPSEAEICIVDRNCEYLQFVI